jgi:mono/diheme cytochrome c family protein
MENQPRYEPLERSEFFPDQRASRPVVEGSVPRSAPSELSFFETGIDDEGNYVDAFPAPVTLEMLERGRERYDIYCSPCHGYSGYGDGMIVQRGFSPPPSLHTDRLRESPPGYYVSVIKEGFGQMYAYGSRVPAEDRWAIAAYMKALQLSQNASLEEVPEELQEERQ